MKCVFCGGETEPKMVTFSYEEGDKFLLVEHVPAEVCTRCREKPIPPEVTDHLLEIARLKYTPVKTISRSSVRFCRAKLILSQYPSTTL